MNKHTRKLVASIVVGAAVVLPFLLPAMPSPKTASAVVSWVQDYSPPVDNLITSMQVYYWYTNSPTTNMIVVATSATVQVTNVTVLGLARGTTYFFTVTSATPTDESDFGQVVHLDVPQKPKGPSSVAVR